MERNDTVDLYHHYHLNINPKHHQRVCIPIASVTRTPLCSNLAFGQLVDFSHFSFCGPIPRVWLTTEFDNPECTRIAFDVTA